jgi:multiple antibiotic resistance protein
MAGRHLRRPPDAEDQFVMKEQLQAIVTVLSLVNPAICGAMFAQIEENRSRGQQVADATKAVLATTVILTVSALIGTQLLHLFGVSLDAFMVAGGGVLAWMGFSMLSGQVTSPMSASAPSNSGASLAPLVLFAASPGTITGVITLSAAHTGLELPVTALVAIAVAGLLTWLVLLLVSRAAKASEGGSARDMITRFMGLIVLSMGVQFALTGLRKFGT